MIKTAGVNNSRVYESTNCFGQISRSFGHFPPLEHRSPVPPLPGPSLSKPVSLGVKDTVNSSNRVQSGALPINLHKTVSFSLPNLYSLCRTPHLLLGSEFRGRKESEWWSSRRCLQPSVYSSLENHRADLGVSKVGVPGSLAQKEAGFLAGSSFCFSL